MPTQPRPEPVHAFDTSAAAVLETEASDFYDTAIAAAQRRDFEEAGELLRLHADRLARARSLRGLAPVFPASTRPAIR